MLRVSRLTDYALVLMTELAQCEQQAQSAQALASATRIHLPMASKTLKKLCQRGLVSSRRGSLGGYVLAQPATMVRVIDVVEAIEGPIALAQCENGADQCALHQHCRVRPHWRLINARLRAELARLTLAELTRPPLSELIPVKQGVSP